MTCIYDIIKKGILSFYIILFILTLWSLTKLKNVHDLSISWSMSSQEIFKEYFVVYQYVLALYFTFFKAKISAFLFDIN